MTVRRVETSETPETGAAVPAGGTVATEAGLRRRVGEIADELVGWPVERHGSRAVIERLGAAGVFAARWRPPSDVCGVAVVEELALRGLTASAVVVSLHAESVVAMLQRFGGPGLADYLDDAVVARAVGCVAASEPGGGSDLGAVETIAIWCGDGWRLEGDKKFVTLATQADFALVLARLAAEGDGAGGLGVFLVPRGGYEIVRTHRLVTGSDLDTSWIRVSAAVPAEHLLGRRGLGLAVVNWGLTKERLAICALVVGACRLALGLAVTHAHRRRQFGRPLIEHQALRLRLAELDAQLHALMSDLRHLAGRPHGTARRIAGLKATAARFGEHCLSECLHVFGGDGYVSDHTPLGRLWRDIRLARVGGGTDEMMWEIAARGLTPDHRLYDTHIPPFDTHD